MTKKQIIVMLVAVVLGLGLGWYVLSGGGFRFGGMTLGEEIAGRNEGVTMTEIEAAVKDLDNEQSMGLVLDALLSEKKYNGPLPKGLKVEREDSLKDFHRKQFQYDKVTRQMLVEHAAVVLPKIMERIRALVDETEMVSWGPYEQWEDPNGKMIHRYLDHVFKLVELAFEVDSKKKYYGQGIGLDFRYGKKSLSSFGGKKYSISISFGLVGYDVVGYPKRSEAELEQVKAANKGKLVHRQVDVEKKNIETLLKAIEAYYQKRFAEQKGKVDNEGAE